MRTDPTIVERSVYRGALAAAALNAFGTPIDILIGRSIPGMPWWPPVLSSMVGVFIGAFLLSRRRTLLSSRFCSTLFAVNTLAVVIALWIGAEHYATASATWTPFQANKLGALSVALLAPEAWAGILSIVGYGGSAIVQFLLFAPATRARLPVGEPWAMLAYGVFSIALLVYRRRRAALEQDLLRAKAAARLARLSLAVRDLANTPIQTIELATSLLRAEHPELGAPLARIDRAVVRLRELNKALASHDKDVAWGPGDDSISDDTLRNHDAP